MLRYTCFSFVIGCNAFSRCALHVFDCFQLVRFVVDCVACLPCVLFMRCWCAGALPLVGFAPIAFWRVRAGRNIKRLLLYLRYALRRGQA